MVIQAFDARPVYQRESRRRMSAEGMSANSRMTVRLAWGAFCVVIAGMAALAGLAAIEKSWSVLIVGAFVAFSASALGTLGGFLFGLPRYNPTPIIHGLAGASAQTSRSSANLEDRAQAASSSVTPGNNLEQISDWLTKLLLGAGLTQLASIAHWMGDLLINLLTLLPWGLQLHPQHVSPQEA